MATNVDEAIAVIDDPPADAGNVGDAAINVEMKEFSPANQAVELANNREGGVVTEDSVQCIITDETSTDWQKSRFSYSLPLSSDVGVLYSAVAKEAGQRINHSLWIVCV